MPSLIVYTKESERYPADDLTFSLDGKSYVFSPRKDNRLMVLDSVTAARLMQAYPGTFTLFANYEGAPAVIPGLDGKAGIHEIAAVVTNHRTLEYTQRAYESFRQFYSKTKTYLIDNGSNDASGGYIKSLDSKHTIAVMNPYNYGHGPAMHQAAAMATADGYKYLFALDSDTVTLRGGILETMLDQLGNGYAIGKVYKTDEHGFVNNSERGIAYAHPAVALYNLSQYAMLRPFSLHGAPCMHNMIDAALRGLKVINFETENYIHHFGTVTVQAVKLTDVNMAYLFVQHPPLVSFVVRYSDAENLKRCIDSIARQTNLDYEIVLIQPDNPAAYSTDSIVARVRGLYIYVMDDSSEILDSELVATVQGVAKNNLYPNIIIAITVDKSGETMPGAAAWEFGPVEGQLNVSNLIVRRELWMTTAINFSGRWDDFETIKDLFSRHDWPRFYWLDKIIARTQ